MGVVGGGGRRSRSQAKEKGGAGQAKRSGVTGAARWFRMDVSRVVVVKSG